jgi:hypothetical protein
MWRHDNEGKTGGVSTKGMAPSLQSPNRRRVKECGGVTRKRVLGINIFIKIIIIIILYAFNLYYHHILIVVVVVVFVCSSFIVRQFFVRLCSAK